MKCALNWLKDQLRKFENPLQWGFACTSRVNCLFTLEESNSTLIYLILCSTSRWHFPSLWGWLSFGVFTSTTGLWALYCSWWSQDLRLLEHGWRHCGDQSSSAEERRIRVSRSSSLCCLDLNEQVILAVQAQPTARNLFLSSPELGFKYGCLNIDIGFKFGLFLLPTFGENGGGCNVFKTPPF